VSVLEMIGNTPLVEITNINRKKKQVRIFAKFEGSNPGGSVKDRPAYYMITKAEQSGALTQDRVIIEPTSGNTGIAIAMIGAAKGYRVKLIMPECVSVERKHVLEAFGAEVVLTPGREKTDGAIRMAHELLNNEPGRYFMPNQFENPHNSLAHYEGTGPEIFEQTKGVIDVFVAGIGTSGTLMGVGAYLKEQKPNVRIIAVEPTVGHTIQGLKNLEESIVPRIFNPSLIDERIIVEDGEAFELTNQLIKQEGLFVGMSSGAAIAGALKIAEQMDKGTIVTILPDRGERYLSTMLFKSICAKCPP
jgi:cysteine synthase B